MRKLAVLRPYFLTWLGTYYFIEHSDVFIALDDALFMKSKDVYSLWHKNTFDVHIEDRSLVLPIVFSDRQPISTIKIKHEIRFTKKHLDTIKHMMATKPYVSEVFKEIVLPLYLQKHEYLIDFNMDMIMRVCQYLGIRTDHIKRSSELDYDISSDSRDKYFDLLEYENCDKLMVDKGLGDFLEDDEDVSAMMQLDETFATLHGENDRLFHVPVKKVLPRNFNILDILCQHGKNTIDFILK